MPPEKKNTFLDAEESDDDNSQGYDSEADELRKGGRGSKRRKLDRESSDGSDNDENDDDDGFLPNGNSDSGPEDDEEEADTDHPTQETEQVADDDDELKAHHQTTTRGAATPSQHQSRPTPATKTATAARSKDAELPSDHGASSGPPPPSLARKNLIASEAAIKKSGVVYLSRIPPYMKPSKLRSLLAPYGRLNRVFLAPEDPGAHARRVRSGGNKKRSYGEGWVEFADKREARAACDLLNARTIGGRKNSFYRDDVWCLRYLRGFKWHHLTDQIAAENAERASRMRAEIARTTRENKEFVRNVERAKMLDGIEAKKKAADKKKRKAGEDGEEALGVVVKEDGGMGERTKSAHKKKKQKSGKGGDLEVDEAPPVERLRTFKQIPLANKKEREDRPEQVQRVLSKIF